VFAVDQERLSAQFWREAGAFWYGALGLKPVEEDIVYCVWYGTSESVAAK